MQVTSPTAAASTAASSTTATKGAATVDYNSFLQLLIAQLKNQDPTQPVDSAQYISQLASFSSVEQAVQTNTKLDSLLTSQSLNQASNMIGRTLTNSDGSVSGVVQSISILSSGATAILDNGKSIALGAGVKVS